jgi:hypothetical protein
MNRPAANGTYVMAGAYIKIYLSDREGKAITEFQNLCRATNWYILFNQFSNYWQFRDGKTIPCGENNSFNTNETRRLIQEVTLHNTA